MALAALLVAGCDGEEVGVDYSGGTFDQRVEIDGTLRKYIVHVPPSLSPSVAAPVILVFHGATQSADEMMLMTWFNPVSDRRGAVVVYLEADGDFWDFRSDIDARFVEEVVNRMEEDLTLDRGRVFATGFSNGALFSQRLACQRNDLIAGVVMVGATARQLPTCSFDRPVPAMIILGDDDPSFPFGPTVRVIGQFSAEESVEWWMFHNECSSDRLIVDLPDVENDGTTVDRWDYPECTANARFSFYHIEGGGHTWPGSPLNIAASLGVKSRDLDASDVIAEFFLSLPGGGA